jgi:hypothetical protein
VRINGPGSIYEFLIDDDINTFKVWRPGDLAVLVYVNRNAGLNSAISARQSNYDPNNYLTTLGTVLRTHVDPNCRRSGMCIAGARCECTVTVIWSMPSGDGKNSLNKEHVLALVNHQLIQVLNTSYINGSSVGRLRFLTHSKGRVGRR